MSSFVKNFLVGGIVFLAASIVSADLYMESVTTGVPENENIVDEKDESLPDEPLRVDGDVQAPKIIKRVNPKYPVSARKNRIQGLVILEAIIDKTGKVQDLRVIESLNSDCDQAAIKAAKNWKFKPGTKDGIPVDIIMDLTVGFFLK